VTGHPLAVVTGASSGIGAEFTRALQGRGYRVMAVARRADRLAALARDSGGAVLPEVLDLTADGAVAALAAHIEQLGGADLVVANAGRGAHGPFVAASHEDVMGMLRLNVTANVDLVGRTLPAMVQRGHGGIIVVSSSLALLASPYLAAYGASKAFLLSFAEALDAEVRGTGVRVMALCPGPTTSEFGEVAGMGDQIERTPGHTSPEQVVAAGLRAWEAGRTVVVPGAVTRLMTSVLQQAPQSVTRRAMARLLR
jgi:uncharacterized protein